MKAVALKLNENNIVYVAQEKGWNEKETQTYLGAFYLRSSDEALNKKVVKEETLKLNFIIIQASLDGAYLDVELKAGVVFNNDGGLRNRPMQRAARELAKSEGLNYTTALRRIRAAELEGK